MIGARIRQARLLAGMTQQDVVDALENAGLATNKAKIIAYEKDRDMPDASTFLELSRIFDVPPVWLTFKPGQDVDWTGYRKRSTLPSRSREAIEGYVHGVAELQTELRTLLCPNRQVVFPERINVPDFEGAEKAARILRKEWQLGEDPIASLTRTAETNGVVVIDWAQPTERLDGLSGWYGDQVPVVVTKAHSNGDVARKRFSLAHELGHLVMNCPENLTEQLANRFAGALLVPEAVAKQEFQQPGPGIGFADLGTLKQKYGLSMQGWVYRAKDLGLISSNFAQSFWRAVNQRGWKKREPFEFAADEKPSFLKQMICRALDKELISPYQVLQVLPNYEIADERGVTGFYPTASELLSMPRSERKRYMDISIALARDEEFERFEVIGGEEY